MKHLLVIRLSALGDVAILAPVLKARAEANPGVLFTLAAPPMLKPLFDGVPNIRFLGVNKKDGTRAIYRQLKSVDADAIADLHVVNRVGHALLLLQLDRLLHFKSPLPMCRLHKGRLSRWLFIYHLTRKPRRPQWQRYDDVFDKFSTLNSQLSTPHSPLSTPHSPLSTTIGIAPFAQHKGKIWPVENVERLVQMLTDKGCRVLLFGSKAEAPQLEEISTRHAPLATNLAGKHTFAEELDIIRSLDVMVSMDSSNMHFASAVGTPVVSIWGATHPDFGFYGYGQPRDLALCADMPCQPCSAYGRKPCRYSHPSLRQPIPEGGNEYKCLSAITPEMVVGKICAVLGKTLENNS